MSCGGVPSSSVIEPLRVIGSGHPLIAGGLSPLRIATWNINGMRARLEVILRWLEERRPDVVGLQELKLTEEKFPAREIESAGYRALIHGQKAWNGVAILSRQEASVLQKGLPGHEESGSRLLSAEVSGIRFTTVYCPNGKSVEHQDYGRKLEWFDGLLDHLGRIGAPEHPSVLCGDFNIVPGELDTHDEERLRGTIFHTEAERGRFEGFLKLGFRDLYRELHPDTRAFTWWDYRAGAFPRNHGLRLDFLLGTPPLADKVRSVQIDRDYRKKIEGMTPSDHAPVLADVDD